MSRDHLDPRIIVGNSWYRDYESQLYRALNGRTHVNHLFVCTGLILQT